MSKRKIIAIVLLVLVIAAVVVGPTLAALVWEHKWDARTVILDRPGSSNFHSYGDSGFVAWSGDKIFYKNFSCQYGERVRVYAKGDGSVSVEGGCAVMTPTVRP